MPTIANSGMIGDPWATCQRCGDTFRVSQLRWQKGLLVCSRDYDNTEIERREAIIKSVLDDAAQEPRVAPILIDPSNSDFEDLLP